MYASFFVPLAEPMAARRRSAVARSCLADGLVDAGHGGGARSAVCYRDAQPAARVCPALAGVGTMAAAQSACRGGDRRFAGAIQSAAERATDQKRQECLAGGADD